MDFEVVLTNTAYSDLDEILAWAEQNEVLAFGFQIADALVEAAQTLAQMPERCPVARQSRRLRTEVRVLLHGHQDREYRIYFRVQSAVVQVFHIRHWARKPLTARGLRHFETL